MKSSTNMMKYIPPNLSPKFVGPEISEWNDYNGKSSLLVFYYDPDDCFESYISISYLLLFLYLFWVIGRVVVPGWFGMNEDI